MVTIDGLGMRQCIRIDTASRMEVVDSIQRAAETMGSAEGLDPDTAHYFSVALREAVVNAITHGDGAEPSRRVQIDLTLEGSDRLVFIVRDEGPGFDPESVPDPLEPENLERSRGRGIFYMRQFSDRVEFRFPPEGGTVVRLEKGLFLGSRDADP